MPHRKSSQVNILLVDDEMAVIDVLGRAAQNRFPEAHFTHVDTFEGASAYLGNLEGRGPRLILLDIDLKAGESGLTFLSRLREHPQGRLIPVIVLSATNEPDKVEEAHRCGASAFTQKPFSYGDWQNYVQTLRNYWFSTVKVPQLWFEKGPDE